MIIPGVLAASGQRPPPPFAPPNIAGLTFWLDASDVTTVFTDASDRVTQWSDKSGNGLNATQSNPTRAFVYGQNQFNGLPALVSPNPSGWAGSIQLPNHPITGSTDRTAFVVIESRSEGGINQDYLNLGGGFFSGNGEWRLRSSQVGGGDTRQLFEINVSDNRFASNFIWPVGTKAILGCRLEGTTVGDHTLYVDGVSEQAVGSRSVNTNPNNEASIGGGSLRGLIAEVIAYTGALSTIDRQTVEGYLAHKWGLVGNLPADHPFKLDAP